jgi:hypothetical protein
MSDPRLAALAIQIETLKARLADISEPRERRVLLQEMNILLQEGDLILKSYWNALTKAGSDPESPR